MNPALPTRSFRTGLLAVICLTVPLSRPLIAQAATSQSAPHIGTISGRVTNQATRAVLEGAQVTVLPSGISTLTDREGQFAFRALPAGQYQLRFTYTGLDVQTLPVTIDGGRNTVLDAELTSGIYMLGAIVVGGEREGSALAITQQRNAPNVKNVLSADAFGSVADENIGNFLLRVPGIAANIQEGEITGLKIRGIEPDLNSVTVDGTRAADGNARTGLNRGFGIDTVPASFVDSIEVTKAPTPDMDADSVGGSVNLRTKTSLSAGNMTSYRIGTSYNTGRETWSPQGNLAFSHVFGKERRLGMLVNLNYSWTVTPHDVVFGAWEPTLDTNRPAWYGLTTAGDDYFHRKRGGLALRFDYRVSQNGTLFVNLMGSQNHDRLQRRRSTFAGTNANTVIPGWTEFVTDTRNITFGLDQTDRLRDVKTYNFQTGGEWRIFGGKIDFSANFSPSKGFETRTNLNPTIPGTGFRFDRTPTIGEAAGATFMQLSGPDVTNPANLILPSVGFTDVRKRDRIVGGQINLRRDFDSPAPSYIKTGIRMRSQQPGTVSRPTTYNYIGPGGAAMERFIDTSYDYQPHDLRGTMPDVKFLDFGKVVHEWETRPEYFTINRVTTLRNELTNDRNASESVYAGYMMGHLQLGRLGALGGLRVEETRVEGTGTLQLISPEERARRAAWVGTVTEEENLRRTQAEYGNRITTKSNYRNVFPSVHFRYELLRGLVTRASYSSGIGRPNFGTIIPNNSINDQNRVVTVNNTGLKPQESDNFDATLEYYFEPAGLLSASVFLKEIKQYIFTNDSGLVPTGTDNGFNGDYGGYRLVTQANGGFARIRGLEVNYQQQFTNLPGIWRGFGIYANHTWLEAIGDYGQAGAVASTGRIPGLIPQTGNIGLTYKVRALNVRLQTNFSSSSIGNINANPSLQQYSYSKRKVDINLTYQKSPALTFFLDVRNVFGDTIGGHPYIYIPERPRGSDRDDPEIKIGVSGQFR